MLKDTKANKIFLLVLVAALAIFFGFGALRTKQNSKMTETFALSDSADLSIRTESDDITLLSDPQATDLSFVYHGSGKATTKRDGEDLSIIVSGGRNGSLTVTIPQSSTLGELSLSTKSGAVDLPSLSVKDDVEIRTISGKVRLADLSAKEIEISTTNGDISLASVTDREETEISSTSGALSLDSYHGSDLYLHTTSGSITAASDMKRGTIRLLSTSGDLSFDLVQEKADYLLEARSTSGQLDLPATKAGDGNVKVTLQSTSGPIRFSSQKP